MVLVIKNNFKSLSISLVVFLSLFFGAIPALAAALPPSDVSTVRQEEMVKNSKSLDALAKRIGVYTMDETAKILGDQSGTFSYLIAFLILLELISYVKSHNFSGIPALKELFDLIFAIAIVGSCISTKVYNSSGLSSVFGRGGGANSGIFLSIDVIYKTKELAENLTTEMLGNGEEIREKFEIARANLVSVIFTGQNTAEATALSANGDKIPPKQPPTECKILSTDIVDCIINKYFTVNAVVGFLFKIIDYLWLALLVVMSILFNLSAAMGLLMFTLIVSFGVLKGYRGRIWTAFKVPLSTALYGSVALLIYRIAGICYVAFARALLETDPVLRLALAPIFIIVLIVLNLAMIGSVTLIPKLARSFLNLSLEEIVGFAEAAATKAWGLGVGIATFGAAAAGFATAAATSKNGATAAGAAAGGAAGSNDSGSGGGPDGSGGGPGNSGISPTGSGSGASDTARNAAMMAGAIGGVKASLDKGADFSAAPPQKSVLNNKVKKPRGGGGSDGPEGLTPADAQSSLSMAPGMFSQVLAGGAASVLPPGSKPPASSGLPPVIPVPASKGEVRKGPEGLTGDTTAKSAPAVGAPVDASPTAPNPNMFKGVLEEYRNPQTSFDLSNNLAENKDLNDKKLAENKVPDVNPVKPDAVSADPSKQMEFKESVLAKTRMQDRVRDGYKLAKEEFSSGAQSVKDGMNNTAVGRAVSGTAKFGANAVHKVAKIATSKGVMHGLTVLGHTAYDLAKTRGDLESASHVFKNKANQYADHYRSGRHNAGDNLIDGAVRVTKNVSKKVTGWFGNSSDDSVEQRKEETPNTILDGEQSE